MSAHMKYHAPDCAVTRVSSSRWMNVILRGCQNAVQNWQRRKMIAALEALDDRILLDIGIDRSEINRVVDGFSDAELRMAPIAPDPKSHDVSYAKLRRAA